MHKSSELLTQDQAYLIDKITTLTMELSSKQLECFRLREALEFYANKSNWLPIAGGCGICKFFRGIGKNGVNGFDTAQAVLNSK